MTLPNLLKSNNWLHSICVVNFDLELGQSMEYMFPANADLSEKDKTNICYLSFPDSNSGYMGDTCFHFRIWQHSNPLEDLNKKAAATAESGDDEIYSSDMLKSRSSLVPCQQLWNQEGPSHLKLNSGVLFGFVYFRQRKDSSLRRGYLQKSVVMLTRWMLPNLWFEILKLLAGEFFERNDKTILECVVRDISKWPDAKAGEELLLPVMGNLIKCRMPMKEDAGVGFVNSIERNVVTGATMSPVISVPSVERINIYEALHTVISHLHLIWELVFTQEPLVVMGNSPAQCSKACQAMIQSIYPFNYGGDYRPFFTIHDPDFNYVSSKLDSPPRLLLGVTNPFFARSLEHWPHIIRLADIDLENSSSKTGKSKRRAERSKILDAKPGVYSKYKTFIRKDRGFIKQMLQGMKEFGDLQEQNAAIVKYFSELTESLVIPLERYVSTLMPLQKTFHPFKSPPKLKPFSEKDFLATLEHCGPQLTTSLEGDWKGLYQKFFRTNTFTEWLEDKCNDINNTLESKHFEAFVETDLQKWAGEKCEVEKIDMILRLKRVLESPQKTLHLPVKKYSGVIEEKISYLVGTLPEDARSLVVSK